MKKLFTKLIRDVMSSRGQFISILLVIILGVAVLCAMLSMKQSLQTNVDNFYTRSNLADIWAEYRGIDQAGIDAIKADTAVSGAQGRLRLEGTWKIGSVVKDYAVYTLGANDSINKPLLTAGTAPANRDQCLVDAAYAATNHIKLGDRFPLTINDQNYAFTVSGFFDSAEYVYHVKDASMLLPDTTNFGVVYLSGDRATSLAGTGRGASRQILYNEVLITKKSDASTNQITSWLSKNTTGFEVGLTRDKQASYSVTSYKIASISKMSVILPVMFFIVAAALIFISMSRLVESQREQIGVMKALGVRRRTITAHYLSFPIVIGLVGSLIAAILGVTVLARAIFKVITSYFILPTQNIYGALQYAALGALLAICFGAGAAFLSCRKTLKESAAELMRPKPPKNAKKIWLESRRGLWNKLSFKSKLIARNIFLNKRRAILGSIGVIGGCALIIAALGLQSTFDVALSRQFNQEQKYDLQVVLDQPLASASEADYSGVWPARITPTTTLEAMIVKGGATADANITALPADEQVIRLTDARGQRVPLTSSGAVFTRKLAQTNHLAVGDTVEMKITSGNDTKTVRLRADAIVNSYLSQGVYASFEALQKAGVAAPCASYYLSAENPRDAVHAGAWLKKQPGVKQVYLKQDIEDSITSQLGITTKLVAIMIVASAVLTLAVIFNITSINIFERRRDVATLKVLGYHLKEVRRLVLTENFLITAFGCIWGIGLGLALQYVLIHSIGTSDMDLPFAVSGASIPVAVVCVFLFTWAANFFLRKRINRIDMVESLKSVE